MLRCVSVTNKGAVEVENEERFLLLKHENAWKLKSDGNQWASAATFGKSQSQNK